MNASGKTEFLPSERCDDEELREELEAVAESIPCAVMDMLPLGVVVLNATRQIVFSNESFRAVAVGNGAEDPLGLRPGEALGCLHGIAAEGGCGTTRFCRHCGAALAIIRGLGGKQAVEDCRLVRKGAVGDEALDLQVFAAPMPIGGVNYCLFSALDVSHERRRSAMERLFFHDVLNCASGIRMLAGLMEDGIGPDREEAGTLLSQSAAKMIGQIMSQKNLLAAEQGRLEVCASDAEPLELLEQIRDDLCNRAEARERLIALAPESVAPLVTDPKLLLLVLEHLAMNALEASEPLSTVTLGCREADGEMEFFVHNEGVMPESVQLQLFKRSFSTRGKGRGLGLYTARLIGEDYLGGQIDFRSDEAEGTVFTLRLPRGIGEAG